MSFLKQRKAFISHCLLFMSVSAVTFAVVDPLVVNVYDGSGRYHFGSLRVAPIDTLYMDPSIHAVLLSHGADSVVRRVARTFVRENWNTSIEENFFQHRKPRTLSHIFLLSKDAAP